MTPTCLVLVDGEHYPPVIRAAVSRLPERGYRPLAALFLGGTEKVEGDLDLGIPLERGEPIDLLGVLIDRHRPDVVIDLSDEPVLDYRLRMRLAGIALQRGVSYRGADFSLEPPRLPVLTSRPSVAVIGTGKRAGKTALSIELARHWRGEGRRVVIVTMGRGGPPDPVVLRAGEFEPSGTGLSRLAELGLHAASDYAEDALLARVDTVGTRRCGGGLAGEPFDDNFHLGVSVAEALEPDLLIFEGSGTAVPPARAGATVLVAPGSIDPEFLLGYLGPYRLLHADALVIIGEASSKLGEEALGINPSLVVFRAHYVVEPTVAVSGRRVVVATTAPEQAGEVLESQLRELGAVLVAMVHHLSNRDRLRAGLAQLPEHDLVLTEIKAAAVDVVIPWARSAGIEVGFLHNRVEVEGGIGGLAAVVEKVWLRLLGSSGRPS